MMTAYLVWYGKAIQYGDCNVWSGVYLGFYSWVLKRMIWTDGQNVVERYKCSNE